MPHKIWYDWEFLEDGLTIKPISLGMVSEDDRELYLINATFFRQVKAGLVKPNKWVEDNVIAKISDEALSIFGWPLSDFPKIVLNFISHSNRYLNREDIELWGHFSAYDHVCLAQLFGPMINLPKPIPMYTNDDMTIRGFQLPPTRPPEMLEHHALWDAKFQKLQWEEWTKE